jgi:FkbM family methyltransferase
MIQWIIRQCAKISSRFHWDLLWRIISGMERSDRLHLAIKILQGEADKLTFRRSDILWTTFAWDHSLTWPLLKDGHFQGDQLNSVIQWMKARDRINVSRPWLVDVGANIGTTSIPMAMGTDARILAIEPFPDNFHLLETNIRQNALEARITAIRSAVSIQNGMIPMIMYKGGSGSTAVKHSGRMDESDIWSEAEVPAAGLMYICESQKITPDQIALVWSDTEGSEADIVKTGGELWKAGVPLYLEVYPRALDAQGGASDLIRLASKYFYGFVSVNGLMSHGPDAEMIPVSHFQDLVKELRERQDLTDILLLPMDFK